MATQETVFSPDALLRLMVKKRISPPALIESLHIEPRTFGSWLAGTQQPRAIALAALSEALGVPESALMEEQS